MKSMWPPLEAIFFMTYFHRVGGAWPPCPPPIRYCFSVGVFGFTRLFHTTFIAALIIYCIPFDLTEQRDSIYCDSFYQSYHLKYIFAMHIFEKNHGSSNWSGPLNHLKLFIKYNY